MSEKDDSFVTMRKDDLRRILEALAKAEKLISQ